MFYGLKPIFIMGCTEKLIVYANAHDHSNKALSSEIPIKVIAIARRNRSAGA